MKYDDKKNEMPFTFLMVNVYKIQYHRKNRKTYTILLIRGSKLENKYIMQSKKKQLKTNKNSNSL